jgi:hypothetical protein
MTATPAGEPFSTFTFPLIVPVFLAWAVAATEHTASTTNKLRNFRNLMTLTVRLNLSQFAGEKNFKKPQA